MEIKKRAWSRFIREALNSEGDKTNFNFEFDVLSKRYGQVYIAFCRAMWVGNDGVMSEKDFRLMNGNMPKGFFEKVIS